MSRCNSRETSVDLPDPEGAEMMKTVVNQILSVSLYPFGSKQLFHVQGLLPDFFDVCFGREGQVGHRQSSFADAGRFR